jgi:hypothetical protein
MPDLAFARLRPILDLGKQSRFNPNAAMRDAFAVGLSPQRITHGEPDGNANRDQYCNVRNRCAHPLLIARKIAAFWS